MSAFWLGSVQGYSIWGVRSGEFGLGEFGPGKVVVTGMGLPAVRDSMISRERLCVRGNCPSKNWENCLRNIVSRL